MHNECPNTVKEQQHTI